MASANNRLYETPAGFQRERVGIDPEPPADAWTRRWPMNEALSKLFDEGGVPVIVDGRLVDVKPAVPDPMLGNWEQQ